MHREYWDLFGPSQNHYSSHLESRFLLLHLLIFFFYRFCVRIYLFIIIILVLACCDRTHPLTAVSKNIPQICWKRSGFLFFTNVLPNWGKKKTIYRSLLSLSSVRQNRQVCNSMYMLDHVRPLYIHFRCYFLNLKSFYWKNRCFGID